MSFLRWIIGDLSRQVERFIPKELDELSQTDQFTIPGLMNCFLALSRNYMRQGRRVYLVVDAVDESKPPRKRLLDVLIKIGTAPEFAHVSLLMTSRDEPDIREAMTTIGMDDGPHHNKMHYLAYYDEDRPDPYTEITMENADVMQAIQTYVWKQLARSTRFKVWDPHFKERVGIMLARNARGM